jgi:hypothetical protein
MRADIDVGRRERHRPRDGERAGGKDAPLTPWIDQLEAKLDGRFDGQSSMDAMRSDLTQVALDVGGRFGQND